MSVEDGKYGEINHPMPVIHLVRHLSAMNAQSQRGASMRKQDIKEQRTRKLSTSVTITCQADIDSGSYRFGASITDNDPAVTTPDQSNDIDTKKSIEKKIIIKTYQYVYM